jgi:hypothetical protein
VVAHFRRCRLDGTLPRAQDRLRAMTREAEGRQAEPPAAMPRIMVRRVAE